MQRKINTFYFSATGTTKKIITEIAAKIAKCDNITDIEEINHIDFTLSEAREQLTSFASNDIVIAGVPVIAGRVPNVLLKYLKTIVGNGALTVAVVVYGNRNYDDALIELKDILEEDGFKVIAAAAFVGEHSFSNILAKNRPDEKDMIKINDFALQIYEKLKNQKESRYIEVSGNKPYRDYYKPKDGNGNQVDIRKVTPKTNINCINCKLCASVCPMGSIVFEDVSKLNGICIKCCACIKKCPVHAKYFDDEHFLNHKRELEIQYSERREPEFFL